MAISLYDCSVACFLQTLTGASAFLEKGLAHFDAEGVDPEEVMEWRLAPDMFPFRMQVQFIINHSAGAMDYVKAGLLVAPFDLPPLDLAGVLPAIAEARARLEALTGEEVDALEGRDMILRARGMDRVFTAEGFLLSFALPNLHFHAATAYDILRSKGAPLGKMDYIGGLRLKA